MKKSSDHDLKVKIGEVLDSFLDLKLTVAELDEENGRLKAELAGSR